MDLYLNNNVTLLSKKQVFDEDTRLDIFNTIGIKCASTDFARLLGALTYLYYVDEEESKRRGLSSWWWLKDHSKKSSVLNISYSGELKNERSYCRDSGIRPAIPYDNISTFQNRKINENGILEVEYGEYPQFVVNSDMYNTLNKAFLENKLKRTGKTYKTDSTSFDFISPFKLRVHKEYEYDGKKYIKVKLLKEELSVLDSLTDNSYKMNDDVWVEVSPIKWLVDEKSKLLVSKYILVGGVRYNDYYKSDADFKDSEINMFLKNYFIKDIRTDNKGKNNNPYNLEFDDITEEDIIKASIECNIPVYLHGASSEGKSSRIKAIDSNCVILYLNNSTPDSLKGKSVYSIELNEMIDIKPSWLNKLEELCESEPDKYHVVFFDELSNALPSIQNMALEIILNKEVNGIWKLPDNARIVAAGNDMKDTIVANRLSESLFSRFAHVYIKTTSVDWLKWAKSKNIHPAIYLYIACKKDKVLRSKYDGIKPNADPRKWEMASNILYKTGNPEMIRSLVGEDITNDFVNFCNINLVDINDMIDLNDIEMYATNIETNDNNVLKLIKKI